LYSNCERFLKEERRKGTGKRKDRMGKHCRGKDERVVKRGERR
jgi:hypothetical protein